MVEIIFYIIWGMGLLLLLSPRTVKVSYVLLAVSLIAFALHAFSSKDSLVSVIGPIFIALILIGRLFFGSIQKNQRLQNK